MQLKTVENFDRPHEIYELTLKTHHINRSNE